MRHMVVVDSDHMIVGMITRKDLTERRLDLHWYREVCNIVTLFKVTLISLISGAQLAEIYQH